MFSMPADPSIAACIWCSAAGRTAASARPWRGPGSKKGGRPGGPAPGSCAGRPPRRRCTGISRSAAWTTCACAGRADLERWAPALDGVPAMGQHGGVDDVDRCTRIVGDDLVEDVDELQLVLVVRDVADMRRAHDIVHGEEGVARVGQRRGPRGPVTPEFSGRMLPKIFPACQAPDTQGNSWVVRLLFQLMPHLK